MPAGSVVAVQLPAISEAVISLLAVLRAGYIAVPVPVLWRRSDLVAALTAVAPKAMLTVARFNDERPAETLCEAAAELFDLSFPCAFGSDVPDGVVPLDRHDEAQARDLQPAPRDFGAPSLVTFDADAEGFIATGRSDAQWLAAGLATLMEARIENGDTIVSTLPLNSLAAIGAAFVPWLLSGGTLELCQRKLPQPDGVGEKIRMHLVAPAAALKEIAGGGVTGVETCIAVHRSPRSHGVNFTGIQCERIVDYCCFGEIGAVPLARRDVGTARSIPLGNISAPSDAARAPVVIETKLAGGQVWLRGPMVPSESFPPGLSSYRTARDPEGFVRTGFKARRTGGGELIVDEGPSRVIQVGGLRFGLDDLQSRFSVCAQGVTVTAIEDPLLGERLHIEAINREAAAAALHAAGHSPLVVDAALRDR
jgi:hypothetical protein